MPYNFPLVEKVVVKLKRSNLDNLVDRAHYLFTVTLISLFALFNAGNLLFGSPIQCQGPAEYFSNSGWTAFVNEFCFITSTYVNEGGSSIQDPNEARIDVSYYQWFAYVLFVQSLLFYAPHFIWVHLQNRADVDIQGVVDQCVKSRGELNPVKKAKAISEHAVYLVKVADQRLRDGHVAGGLGDMATLFYLASKLLNLVNVFLQFQLINMFVGRGRLNWGFQVVHDALNGIFWTQTGFFPRLSVCKFPRDDLIHTVVKEANCVLMLNMLNEKMFAFLYFWFLLLFVVTLADLVYALSIYLCDNIRLYTGRRYLSNLQQISPGVLATADSQEAFVMEILGRDGLMLLRFIESHAGVMVASQLACRLFEMVHTRNGGAGGAHGGDDVSSSAQVNKKKVAVMGDFV